MKKRERRDKLNWLSLGFSLASVHYGLGFLLGTGEAIVTKGSLGIIYPLSCSLGLLSLTLIAPFYLKKKEPIWILMGNKYGELTGKLVGFLSGFWMVGVVASQILGGAWALSVFGFNYQFSLILIALLIFILSTLNIERLSKAFFFLLLSSSFILLLVLFEVGIGWFPKSVVAFTTAWKNITPSDMFGTIAATVIVTFLGMDFHQFVVKSLDKKNSWQGCLFGSVILLILSFLLLSIVNGAIDSRLISGLQDPKQVVPVILANFGKKNLPFLSVFFSLPLVLVSIGSGSAVAKIVSKTFDDLNIFPKISKAFLNTKLITVIIALLVSLSGSSIIGLIVSFYAVYASSIIIPFIAYVVQENNNRFVLPHAYMINSIALGTISSVVILLLPFSIFPFDRSTSIILFGIIGSLTGLVVSLIFDKFLIILKNIR